MAFLETFLISLALTVAGLLLAPKPKIPGRKASSLGDFRVPTATNDRVIPVLWGRVRVKGANVIWYGDLYADPITDRVRVNPFKKKSVTVGHDYRLTVVAVLGYGPIDEIHGTYFSDKPAKFDGNPAGSRVDVNNPDTGLRELSNIFYRDPELLGGRTNGGGVRGNVLFYYGQEQQRPPSAYGYPVSVYGDYEYDDHLRGVAYVIFPQFRWGESTFLPDFAVELTRLPKGIPGLSSASYANVGGEANPAAMIYEVLTNAIWGCALPQGTLDVQSFRDAALTLFAEGFGLSMIVDSLDDAEDVILNILRHIDGVMYSDLTTGLLTIKLIRNDYNVNTVPTFDESNVVELQSFSRGAWSETANSVTISYTDREQEYTTQAVTQQNIANIDARGGQISAREFDYGAISKRANAATVAARMLQLVGAPLVKVQFTARRTTLALRPGSVFKLSWPEYGVQQLVCRVTDINYGTLEDPTVTITGIEDIFAVDFAAFDAPPPSGWVDPLNPVPVQGNVIQQEIGEVPDAAGEGLTNAILYLIERPTGTTLSYDVFFRNSDEGIADYVQLTSDTDFYLRGTIATEVFRLDGQLGLAGWQDKQIALNAAVPRDLLFPDYAGGTEVINFAENDGSAPFALVNGEFIRVHRVTATPTQILLGRLYRGMYDTQPGVHAAGGFVYLFPATNFDVIKLLPGAGPTNLRTKVLHVNLRGRVNLADAIERLPPTIQNYGLRPLPPRYLRVNSHLFPTALQGEQLTMTWGVNDRIVQRGLYADGGVTDLRYWLLPSSGAPGQAPAEGAVTLRARVDGADILTPFVAASTDDALVVTAEDRLTGSTDGLLPVVFEAFTTHTYPGGVQRDSRVSSVSVIYTGLGMTLGEYLGGADVLPAP